MIHLCNYNPSHHYYLIVAESFKDEGPAPWTLRIVSAIHAPSEYPDTFTMFSEFANEIHGKYDDVFLYPVSRWRFHQERAAANNAPVAKERMHALWDRDGDASGKRKAIASHAAQEA